MAVADARKAADMFNTKLIQVPILGVVENMAWFTPEKHPNEKYWVTPDKPFLLQKIESSSGCLKT